MLQDSPGCSWMDLIFFLLAGTALFWIYCENNVGNILMFYLLLSRFYIKDFSVFHALPVSSCKRSWKGVRPADPNRSKGYSLPQGITLSIKKMGWGINQDGGRRLFRHQLAGGDQLHYVSLAFTWGLFLSPHPSFVFWIIFLFNTTTIIIIFYYCCC